RGKNHNKSANADGVEVVECIKNENCDEIVVEPEIHFMIGSDGIREPDADRKKYKDADLICGDSEEQNIEERETVD
ncbi:hypothetical protein SK128_015459, partial [Halocaridina rubra]